MCNISSSAVLTYIKIQVKFMFDRKKHFETEYHDWILIKFTWFYFKNLIIAEEEYI